MAKREVEPGELCSFYPSLHGSGGDTADSFLASAHIKRKGVKVRASHSLTAKLAEVSPSMTQLVEKKLNGTNGNGS